MCSGQRPEEELQQLRQTEQLHVEEEEVEQARIGFDQKFLRQQRSATVQKVGGMTLAQRLSFGLGEKAEIEAVAPPSEAELSRLSRRQRKAARKAWKEEKKARERQRQEQESREQEQAQRDRQVNLAVEQELQNPAIMEFARSNNMGALLDPNSYAGGEDDVINTTILREMTRIPAEFGLAEEDSPQAGGFTVANAQALLQLNDQIRYMKWRNRAASDIVQAYYTARQLDDDISDEAYEQASRMTDQLSDYTSRMDDRILVLERALQNSMTELVNHRNLQVPAQTEARVKKRAHSLPTLHSLKEHYARAVQEESAMRALDKLDKIAARETVTRELARQGGELADQLLAGTPQQQLVKEKGFTPEAVSILHRAMNDCPPPADPAYQEAYQKALNLLIARLGGLTSISISYETKKFVKDSHPDFFSDPESAVSQKQQELIDSELVLVESVRNEELPPILAQLARASAGQPEPPEG